MGLRAGLDRFGKSRPPPGFDPRTVQPVGSRYTDYATRPVGKIVHCINSIRVNLPLLRFDLLNILRTKPVPSFAPLDPPLLPV